MKDLFEDRQNWWHVIFGLAYLVAAYLLAMIVRERSIDLFSVSVFEFTILSLAVSRLIRLVTYDYLTKFFRDWLEKSKRGFKRELADLFECPWCTGVWMGLIAGYMFLFPETKIILFLLALSGVGTYFQIIIWKIGLEPGEK